jgi:hypothetical protein
MIVKNSMNEHFKYVFEKIDDYKEKLNETQIEIGDKS